VNLFQSISISYDFHSEQPIKKISFSQPFHEFVMEICDGNIDEEDRLKLFQIDHEEVDLLQSCPNINKESSSFLSNLIIHHTSSSFSLFQNSKLSTSKVVMRLPFSIYSLFKSQPNNDNWVENDCLNEIFLHLISHNNNPTISSIQPLFSPTISNYFSTHHIMQQSSSSFIKSSKKDQMKQKKNEMRIVNQKPELNLWKRGFL